MARSRNIKPAFFNNDELAEIDPLGRLFFIGLWTIADYQGSFIWREKRLKAMILPYDNCDVKQFAINLDKSGFIQFYTDGVEMYAKIVNFELHQNPHKNERAKGSDIPEFNESSRQVIDFKGLTIKSDKIEINPDLNDSDRADSLNLIPETFKPITDSLEKPKKKRTVFAKPSIQDAYDYFFEKTSDNNYSKVESEKWWYFYDSKDWVVGKTKMKNWKSSISGWINRNSNQPVQPRYATQQSQAIDMDDDSFMDVENFADKFGVNS